MVRARRLGRVVVSLRAKATAGIASSPRRTEVDTARAYAPETSLLHASHRRVVGGQYGVVLHLTREIG